MSLNTSLFWNLQLYVKKLWESHYVINEWKPEIAYVDVWSGISSGIIELVLTSLGI